MKTMEWHFDDKSEWGEGDWQGEPDKLQWSDEETGLPCLIHRNGSGALCGYVGVPERHPWFELDYDKVNDLFEDDIVHGDLTFSAHCQPTNERGWGICHVPEPGEPDNVWWLGFDAAHFGDFMPAPGRFFMPAPGRFDTEGEFRTLLNGLFERSAARFKETYRDLGYMQNECRALALAVKEASSE